MYHEHETKNATPALVFIFTYKFKNEHVKICMSITKS